MLRKLHLLPGLIAGLLMTIIALSGAVLSVQPTLERVDTMSLRQTPGSIATLADNVTTQIPGVETIVRRSSGTIIAYHEADGQQRASVIAPATGEATGGYGVSPMWRWMKNLHRKLFLGNAGRIAAGVTAACMLLVAMPGLALLARRMGGWRLLLGPIRGNGLQRLHNETARVVLAGLTLSAATGLIMSMTTFGLVPEGGGHDPAFSVPVAAAPAIPLGQMAALDIEVSRLHQLTLPNRGDPGEAVELALVDGVGYIDPSTGQWLAWQSIDGWQRMQTLVRKLHTGQGLWWLGLMLGVASLSVPLLAVTGLLLWLRRRRAMPTLADNAPTRDADTVLLVGTEGNTTWGFASALHGALTTAGLRVHTAPMNEVAVSYSSMKRLVALTATYGDGDAPESARRFLSGLQRLTVPSDAAFAVLGFGDRQFLSFCAYARQVHDALAAKGFTALADPGTVDRQSEPEFRQWCTQLAEILGIALDLHHTPLLPPTVPLKLVSREDYGRAGPDMTSVLRFERDASTRSWDRWLRPQLPTLETGNLLGIVPPGATAPRYYSLASGASDGVVEICVRRLPDGACSTYLTDLQPGETVAAFIRPHTRFRPGPGNAPVILIGAGTGISPLIGFIRHNAARRPMLLYFGARNAEDDFLYREELSGLVANQRLQALRTAFSRSGDRTYVQDQLVVDGQRLRSLVAHGAQIMVCGGRKMAEGVAQAWERILADTGASVMQLRAEGRYVEDIY